MGDAMKCVLPLVILLVVLLSACGSASPLVTAPSTHVPEPRTLTVLAAGSLTDAFAEIGTAFEAANPGVTVLFNFAGSQGLRTQIEEGAPADVFASANAREMDTLVEGGYVARDVPKIFLTNKLSIILPADNPAEIEKLEDLAVPGIKLVLAAEEVPVGKYARQALDQMNVSFGTDFKDKVIANVVSNEDNVRQVVTKIQLGEADAGIVYTSDASAASDLKTIEIPADLNVIAHYPIAPLVESANPELAAKFIQYILSADGQAVLKKWGFGPIP
jgi:molybdate transport system substrate-binding protein